MPKVSSTELTPIQRRIVNLRRIRSEVLSSIDEELRAIESLNKMRCEHPLVEDYNWEHDDGYGRQRTVTGARCVLCRATRSWRESSLWYPED